MIDTRIFLPPTLCGCELQIRAEWIGEPENHNGNRASFKHPRPFSIDEIVILNVCAEHEIYKTELPTDPYWDLHTEPVGKTSSGYICVGDTCVHPDRQGEPKHTNPKPYASLSEGEKVYINLWRFSGMKKSYKGSCDCEAFICHSKEGEMSFKNHPKHTKKCRHHKEDDENCTVAESECRLKQEIENTLREDPTQVDEVAVIGGKEVVLNATNRNLIESLGIDIETKLIPEVKYNEQREIEITNVRGRAGLRASLQAKTDKRINII